MRLMTTYLLLALTTLSSHAYAEKEEPLYLVEIIFFLHTAEENKTLENWSKNINLDLKEPQAFLVNDSRESIYPDIINYKVDNDDHAYPVIYSYTKGQKEDPVFPEGIELVLRDKAKKINSVGRYQLIQHTAFAQRIDTRFKDKANNIMINIDGVTRKNEQPFKISGSFTLHKNRFLHLNTDLWITFFNQEKETAEEATGPIEADNMESLLASSKTEATTEATETSEAEEQNWPQLPEVPQFKTATEANNYIKAKLKAAKKSSAIIMTEETEKPEVADQNIQLISKLSQSRKMRSKETHYIDHPLFGVVIEIREFPKPELVENAVENSNTAAQ